MKFVDPNHDRWQHALGEDGALPAPQPAPDRLLTLEQWHAVRGHWPADLPVAVELSNDADLAPLAPDLPRLALLVLNFPKWTDGRAYSQARLLRARYRYAGGIRARGEVLVDMVQLLDRTGFTEAQLRGDQSPLAARRALAFFTEGFYQGDVHEARPRFARA